MIAARRRLLIALASAAALAGGTWWWQYDSLHYLDGQTGAFVQLFAEPPARDSPQTRRELDELLELQRTRTAAQVEAARADRKTEIGRFYAALGIGRDDGNFDHPLVRRLAQRTEDDVRIYVRAAKYHFLRLRPYEIEPRLTPCIDNVRDDLSYPSGHAAYGYSMAYLLELMVPERRQALERRAEEFARQRMVCGVHFRSDLDAGRLAARWLIDRLRDQPQFRSELAETTRGLRAALQLPQAAPRLD